MSEPTEITIDGMTFRMVQLDGEAGFHFALDILRIFGAAAPALVAGNSDASVLAGLARITREDADRVLDTIGTVTMVSLGHGKWRQLSRDVRREVFAGKQMTQFVLIGKAIGVQLADFFGSKTSGAPA